ncbi:MAG TPA: PAS domain S-box protein [Syntrophorhabdaceae bacterium]|jgi:diguanylate cyclase (GGDEF)-like protein/PAS domain S-box-containing protein
MKRHDRALTEHGQQYREKAGSLPRALAEFDVRREGGTAWVSVNARAVRADSGKFLSYEGTFEDIAARIRIEQALRGSEEKFSKAFNALPVPLSIISVKDGRYIEVNEAFELLWGYERSDVIGRSHLELGMWTSIEQWEFLVRLISAQKRVANLELLLCAKTGEEKIVLCSAEMIELAGEPCILFLHVDITERKQTEEALRRTNSYNRSLIEAGLDPLVMIGPDGRISDVNSAGEQITGRSRQDLIGTDFSDYFTEPEKARAVYWRVFRDGQVRDVPLDLRHCDGRVASVLYNASVYWDEDGSVIGVAAAARDITERRQAEMRLRESEERYRTAIEHSNDGVALTRRGVHLYVNRKFLEIFGYSGPEDIIGNATHKEVHPDDREMVMEYDRKRRRGEEAPARYEYKGIKKDGSVIFVEASVASTVFRGEPASLAYLRDITERKEMEEKLRTLSIEDELTGLHNRRGFMTLSAQQLKAAQRRKEHMALIFMDLDGLKSINDTRGHQEGDRMLIAAAQVLQNAFRGSDIIGRMGGDEFAVLTPYDTGADAEGLMDRARAAVEEYNGSGALPYRLSMSLGAALYDPEKPRSLDELIEAADAAMYRDKKKKGPRPRKAPAPTGE